jgi:hypothetical protein
MCMCAHVQIMLVIEYEMKVTSSCILRDFRFNSLMSIAFESETLIYLSVHCVIITY